MRECKAIIPEPKDDDPDRDGKRTQKLESRHEPRTKRTFSDRLDEAQRMCWSE